MKQTFLPIVVLLAVTLTLFAFLYFTDPSKACCEKRPQAKRVRISIVL